MEGEISDIGGSYVVYAFPGKDSNMVSAFFLL